MTGQQQAEKYQQDTAKFGQVRGIPASDVAQLAGGLLQFSEGPQKVEDLEARFGKVFKTLERAPTPVSQLLPQMSRVQAQGASPEEASELLSIMSEAMPGEEETGVTNALKAITNQTLEGKGEALGQKEGMTPLQKIKAATSAIQGRVNKGENLDKILHEVAPDLRQSRGLKALSPGAFRPAASSAWRSTRPRRLRTSWRRSSRRLTRRMRAARARSMLTMSLADIERGERFANVERLKKEAAAELKASGRFDKPHVEDIARNAVANLPFVGTGVSAKDQLINELAYDKAFKASGLPSSQRVGIAPGAAQAVADDQIRKLVEIGQKRSPGGGEKEAMGLLRQQLGVGPRGGQAEQQQGDPANRKLLERQVQIQERQLQLQEQAAKGGAQGHPVGPAANQPIPRTMPPQARGGVRQ